MNPAQPAHLEIERRFLVETVPDAPPATSSHVIDQGYLSTDPAVRLRRMDDEQFFMTIKRGRGAVREEREVALTREQFTEFWPLTAGRRLHKIRRRIPWQAHVIELDSFDAPHLGLHIAEVEFPDEATMRAFQPPAWFGREVTGESAYANVTLARS